MHHFIHNVQDSLYKKSGIVWKSRWKSVWDGG